MDGIMKEDEQTPVHFGRWLLKHCDTTQQDGSFCWIYKGDFYDTAEIFEIFKNE
jgi:hypothetical protein